MTLKQALTLGREQLTSYPHIEDPSLEGEVLLKHVLQIDRAKLYLDLAEDLDSKKEKEYRQWISRRLAGEPLAYIIRNREFWGLDFYVDTRTLIPRPETELLVEEAIKFSQERPVSVIADIGTGSGAVAVSLAVNLPQVKIHATDISIAALEVAQVNCRKHHVSDRVILHQGDLLNPLPEPVDILIANLPYVKKSDLAGMPSAKYEPALALDGGESGLDKIFQLCRQLTGKLRPNGILLLEIGMGQDKAVVSFLQDIFPSASVEAKPDLARINRVVKIIL